ncbi:MAG: sensor histidine kinase, partial [Anaerolineales bacterium]
MKFLLLSLLLLLALLTWHSLTLRRRLGEYARHLRQVKSLSDLHRDFQGLEDLSTAVYALLCAMQERLNQALAERARLTMLLEQLSDAVILVNESGQVTFLNPAAERLFQIPSQRALGRSTDEVLRHHRLIETWKLSQQHRTMQSAFVEWPLRRLFLQCIVVPDQHTPGGSLILVQDLTRLRHLETVRRDFVANFSHEMRTPLAALRALAETLREGALEDPAVARRFLEQIEREVDALTRLAEGMLELSQLEAGVIPLQIQPVAVCPLLQQAIERMRPLAEQAGITMILECPANLPPVLADRGRLEQVLINLLHNAIKFSPPNKKVWLSVTYQDGAEYVHFLVRDEGVGIAPDDLPRIFERFYKAGSARGHGLGLA